MTGIGIILKSLGVKFEQEHIAQIEAMIPQIPGVLQNIVQTTQAYLNQLEARQKTLEHAVITSHGVMTELVSEFKLLKIAVGEMEKALPEREALRLSAIAQLIDGYAERLESINASIRSGELQRADTPGAVGSGGGTITNTNGKPAKHRRI